VSSIFRTFPLTNNCTPISPVTPMESAQSARPPWLVDVLVIDARPSGFRPLGSPRPPMFFQPELLNSNVRKKEYVILHRETSPRSSFAEFSTEFVNKGTTTLKPLSQSTCFSSVAFLDTATS
jgi:hypothetical protein